MSKVEDVAKDYLVDKDMAIIEAWAKEKMSVGISFRPAGEKTLKCLKRGAGAKPHEILDKTLKRKEGNSPQATTHNDVIDAFFKGFVKKTDAADKTVAAKKIDEAKDLLEGMVGHWIEGQVDGVYLTSLGYSDFTKAGGFVFGTNKNNMPYLVLANEDQKIKLISHFHSLYQEHGEKAYYLFTRRFFSGDYDVHDLLKDRWPVPTLKDLELLEDLQKALIAGRKAQLINDYHLTQGDFTGELDKDYRRVQHGPQHNYTAQMLNENNKLTDVDKINILVESVMDLDPPVAVYDNCALKGNWDILSNDTDVYHYYEKYGHEVKETWRVKEGRERFIRNNIKRIAKLCFPDAGLGTKVTSTMLLEKVPQLKEVYGNDYEAYADAALKEL